MVMTKKEIKNILDSGFEERVAKNKKRRLDHAQACLDWIAKGKTLKPKDLDKPLDGGSLKR